ncbi:MAG: prolipoprotein diacylglyceryl transferase [bacterium]|nr:prolipoprotein diacylglyceryl transferase [bacterium]
MRRELIHICGPISIYSYGIAITLGVLIFMWLVQKHPLFKKLHLQDTFVDILIVGIVTGVIGGRLFYVLSEPDVTLSLKNFISFWEGGFSILGTILALVLILPIFLKKRGVPILPVLDLFSIYVPLLQSISRVGCFLAGCCYGIPSNLSWAITYTNSNTVAPLFIAMHPTQLYSVIILLIIFLTMFLLLQKIFKKPGQLTCIYLALASAERFIVDFWRADRTFFAKDIVPLGITHRFSISQLIALGIFVIVCIVFIYISTRSHKHYE